MLLYENDLVFPFSRSGSCRCHMENKRKHTFNALTAICICRTGSLCILHGMRKSGRLFGCQFSNILLICIHGHGEKKPGPSILFSSPPGVGGGLLAALDLFQETQMFSRGDSGLRKEREQEGWICRQLQPSTLLASNVWELFLSVTNLQ